MYGWHRFFLLLLLILLSTSFGFAQDLGELSESTRYAVIYTANGDYYFADENYAQAETEYGQALTYDENFAPAYMGRGISRYYLGDYEGAIDDLDEAEDLGYGNSYLYLYRGLAQHDSGQYLRAINDYQRALHFEPESGLLYANIGSAQYSLGHYQEAIEALNSAIEFDYATSYVYYYRGLSYDALGQDSAAEVDFRYIIETDYSYWWAYLALGDMYLENRRYNDARLTYTDGLHVSDDPGFYLNRGHAYYYLEYYGPCTRDETVVIERDVQEYLAAAHYWRGYCYLELEDFERAYADADASLQVNRNYYWSYYLRAEAGYALGIDYYEQAIADYQTYEERSGEDLSSADNRRVYDMQQALDAQN